MYFKGLGVEPDAVQAREWLQKAADQGVPMAGELLAELLLPTVKGMAGKVVQANQGKEGQAVDLKALAVPGRRVVVDFFSPACPPCVALAPHLEGLAAKTDWIVVKVNINRPGVKEIDWDSPVAKQFELESVPHLKLVDAQGTTVAAGAQAMEVILRQMQQAGVE